MLFSDLNCGIPKGTPTPLNSSQKFFFHLCLQRNILGSKTKTAMTPHATSTNIWALCSFLAYSPVIPSSLSPVTLAPLPPPRGADRPHNLELMLQSSSFQRRFKKLPFGCVHHWLPFSSPATPAHPVQILSPFPYCLTPRYFLSVKANLCFQ